MDHLAQKEEWQACHMIKCLLNLQEKLRERFEEKEYKYYIQDVSVLLINTDTIDETMDVFAEK